MVHVLLATEVLARGSSDWVGPGLAGFVVIGVLGVAVYFLWRSMNHQLRKVRFEEHPGTEDAPRSPDAGGRRPTGSPENGQT